jgi:HK97 family phage major capsid protein
METEYFPSWAVGTCQAIFGDFSQYYIAESLNFNIQVATELYAEQNMNGYFARAELDGAPVQPESFIHLKIKS